MKKIIAVVLAIATLTFAAAFAAGNITLDDAKQIALDRAGAAAEDAVYESTSGHRRRPSGLRHRILCRNHRI